MSVVPFHILSHTADTGIEATADSLALLIDQLATGMFASMSPADQCPRVEEVQIDVSASTVEDLVVDTLAELLYVSETEDLMLCDFQTTILGPARARVSAGGFPVGDLELTGPPIKAVTYHELVVAEGEDGWFGRVYFDV